MGTCSPLLAALGNTGKVFCGVRAIWLGEMQCPLEAKAGYKVGEAELALLSI